MRPNATPGSMTNGAKIHWIALLFTSLVVFVGLPAALVVSEGAPPWRGVVVAISHPRGLVHSLSEPIGAPTLGTAALFVAWILWIWLVLCLLFEVLAHLRGRPVTPLPASRHIQVGIAVLISAALSVGAGGRSSHGGTRGHATGVESRPSWSLVAATVSPTVGEQLDDRAGTADGPLLYIVRSGDTLWSIAEEQLGDPLRWHQIAALNQGRLQADGDRLTNDNWILPGWRLELPHTLAMHTPAHLSGAEASTQPSVSSAGPDTSPAKGDSAGPDPHRASGPTGSRMVRPNDETAHVTGEEGQPGVIGPLVPGPAPRVPVEPVGFGLLGAGVLGLLAGLRRAQQRHRRSGLRIALPTPDLIAVERGIRLAADSDGAQWVDLALRAVAAGARKREEQPPRIATVHLNSEEIEMRVVSEVPSGAWAPFGELFSPYRWVMPRRDDVARALRDDPSLTEADAPYPSMVTLGRDAHGEVLIDVESAGSIGISGPEADVVLHAMLVELATVERADQVEIIAVGFDPLLERFERVRVVDTVSAALDHVAPARRDRSIFPRVAGRSGWELRLVAGRESWDTTIVICSADAVRREPEAASQLVSWIPDGMQGVAAIVASDHSCARWRVSTEGELAVVDSRDGDTVDVPAVGLQKIEPGIATDIAGLVAVASDRSGVGRDAPPYSHLQPTGTSADPGLEDWSSHDVRVPLIGKSPHDVEVCVLGPVEIIGAARPFTRAWSIELVVYLAAHPGGASNDQWAAAIWPDRLMAPSSLHSTASAARRALGSNQSGEDHLPRSHGRLELGPTVTSDWNALQIEALSADPDGWERALRRIRGRPFEGLRSVDWVILEGILAEVEATVVDLSSRHAHLCLERGEADGATWSARQALKVSAYDERLYRILMRAADLAGNPAGVESVMDELVTLVAEDVEPFDAVHPETLELYRELSRRRRIPHAEAGGPRVAYSGRTKGPRTTTSSH